MIKMKRLSTIIMALALVLGMSQCKKQETPTNGNSGEMVHITLNVNDSESLAVNVNDNGGKHAVAPSLGVIQFTAGDKLYVGNNNHYVGYLNYVVDESGRRFAGDINGEVCSTSDKLHFYFLGGKGPDVTTISDNPESFTISIADQSTNLPVLCYGVSSQFYGENGENTNYSAVLEYKCALVRFDLENHGEDYTVTLSGVPTQATVNFDNPTATTAIVATANQTNANMTLYGEPGNAAYRWAILLKGTNLENAQGLTIGSTVANHVMDNNTYINSGIQIANVIPSAYVEPTEAQKEYFVKTSANALTKFSVGDNKKVYFSRANLRAHYNNQSQLESWSFPTSQYEDAEGPLKSSGYDHQVGTVNVDAFSEGDKFTWGYGNYSQTSTVFYTENRDLSKEVGYLTDWGCAFSEDSNEGGNWRTLSADEWNYLFNNTSRGDYRYLRVQLAPYVSPNNSGVGEPIHGIFVFPDNFTPDGLNLDGTYFFNGTDAGTPIPSQSAISGYRANRIIITRSEDAQKMLDAGAVFLPAAGYRYNGNYYLYYYYNGNTSTPYNQYNLNAYGYYWTSTHYDSDPTHQSDMKAYAVYFDNSCVKILDEYTENHLNVMYRNCGCCVRLVWDADPN
jgi:hypothetical protein